MLPVNKEGIFMNINEYREKLISGKLDSQLELLYKKNGTAKQRARYVEALDSFSQTYPERGDIHVYSASGRTEIGGNHTDHQHGCVIAAAVNLDVIGVAAFHNEGVIRIKSKGYEPFEVTLSDLGIQKGEEGSAAIVRGIAARFAQMGVEIGGFDMYTTSDVIQGSGISSSAAFENLISTSIDSYYNENRAGAVEIAKIGQFAENVYFGKNSGLMDQLVSSVGGFVFIDFADVDDPAIEKVDFDLESAGCKLIITDTKGSHCDLTADYDAVRSEMEAVAEYFGKSFLRETDEAQFWEKMPDIRRKTSDRAVMRAAHFFADSRRAGAEKQALAEGDFGRFLALVNESGDSSMDLLQNLYSVRKPTNQEIPLAIMAGKRILGGRGAIRVHGGGFAGTIQAFVPDDLADAYQAEMDRIFGENSCYIMTVRPVGGIEIA